MKKLFSLFVLSFVTFALVACGGSGDANELKTVSMFGGTDPNASVYEEIIEQFETDHDVTINDTSATSNEIWKTSVVSSFYSGTEPDVLFFFTGETAKPIVENDMVVSIEEIREEYPEYASNISPSVLDPHAVPIKGFVEGVFVNTELFTGDLASYLDKDVWTWADYQDIADKLIAKNIIPFAFGAEDVPHYWVEHLILAFNGPEAFTNIPSAADFDQSTATAVGNKWVSALEMINTLADDGWFGDTKGNQKNETANQLFKTGQAAMILDGSWFAGGLAGTDVDPDQTIMMPFPAIPTSEGGMNKVYMQSGFTSGFYITRKAWEDEAKRDLAVEFINAMTSTESIGKYASLGGVPADTDAVIENLNGISISMNTMPSRTEAATLPLSDAATAGSFTELVKGASSYIEGTTSEIRQALINFANLQ